MGRSIGKEVPLKAPIRRIRIDLYWQDGFGETTKGFDNVQELADFLKANPLLAEGVEYKTKR